jgi:hypothetical protein
MNKTTLTVSGESEAVETLARLLRLLGFAVSAAGEPAPPGPEHRARELLHRRTMLTHCLQLTDVTDAEWRRWPRQIAGMNRRLGRLYAKGLNPNFLGDPAPRSRYPQSGGV